MKISKYVSCLHVGDHTLVYNAVNNSFVVIKHHLVDKSQLINLAESSPSLHQQLFEAEIYVPKEKDETQELIDRMQEADSNMEEYLLDINPTLDCNFKCWYCYENHVKDSLMSSDNVGRVKKLITDIVGRDSVKLLSLGFFGGEPLIGFHKIAAPLIHHAAEECKRLDKQLNVHFTTNAGLLENKMIEFLAAYNCGMQITFDGGKKRHDKVRFFKGGAGSYDIILNGIKDLLIHKIGVTVRINYDTNNVDTVDSLINDIESFPEELRQYMTIDFQRVWQDRDHRSDETEAKAMILRRRCGELGINVACHFIHRDIRWSCYADKINHALVNYDGYVFACTARDFTPDSSIGQLSAEGKIIYRPEVMEVRRSAKLAKSICRECRIAPICGGGCSQKAMEGLGFEGCNQGYSEIDKDNKILDIFQYSVMGEYPK